MDRRGEKKGENQHMWFGTFCPVPSLLLNPALVNFSFSRFRTGGYILLFVVFLWLYLKGGFFLPRPLCSTEAFSVDRNRGSSVSPRAKGEVGVVTAKVHLERSWIRMREK